MIDMEPYREEAKKRRITQEKIAEKAFYDVGTVSRVMRNYVRSIDAIEAILGVLGYEIKIVKKGEQNEN